MKKCVTRVFEDINIFVLSSLNVDMVISDFPILKFGSNLEKLSFRAKKATSLLLKTRQLFVMLKFHVVFLYLSITKKLNERNVHFIITENLINSFELFMEELNKTKHLYQPSFWWYLLHYAEAYDNELAELISMT